MTDREYLELAAKAAGIKYDAPTSKPHQVSGAWFGLWMVIHEEPYEGQRRYWNPLTNDGDALRLAVQLGICFGPNFDGDTAVAFGREGQNICEDHGTDRYAATRRAIVRAAALTGKTVTP